MNVQVTHGSLHERGVDAVVVGVFESAQPEGAAQAVDQALGGAVSELIAAGDFGGKNTQVSVLYPREAIPARRLILVGLGAREKFDLDGLRRAAARGAQKARDLKAGHVASALYEALLGTSTMDAEVAAQAEVEGVLLGLYRYHGQKSEPAPEALPHTLQLVFEDEQDVPAAQRGVDAAAAVAGAVALARDLVNLPPNICTPTYIAERATDIAKSTGLSVQVLERGQMEALGMGALLGVAQGSDHPPRFIILEHNADRAADLDTIVLVGKGITFDTGGYNLKSAESMAEMKTDMAGAAAVIGALQAIAALDVPLHVVGLAPAVDNMISGHAYRPQEVLTASNGVTIEIGSTDAEGRLLLADALVFAERFEPAAVVDIATLTGSCVVALGKVAAGLFSIDEGLRDALMDAAATTGEKLWPLPIFPEYEKSIESQTADIKNTGGRFGGVGSSAAFLKHFVAYPAWAHVDMAGVAFDLKDQPYIPAKSATGYGVRLLTEFVRRWARENVAVGG